MPKVVFIEYSGKEHVVEAAEGQSLMQVATSNNIAGIVGDCGGYCNCATCHAYIDAPWKEKLAPPAQDEQDLLQCAMEVRDTSRLTCQIKLAPELDGIVVSLPESQF